MHSYDPSACSGTATAVLIGEERPEVRIDKILDIRRQLGEGRYSITERLDVVVDRLLDVLRK
ncbi:MAG: hypothetical protein JW741_27365 [Sedimentisphaerales bacterium]|nr:hypothetical protein [Sedimentisphaerales bacterium]